MAEITKAEMRKNIRDEAVNRRAIAYAVSGKWSSLGKFVCEIESEVRRGVAAGLMTFDGKIYKTSEQ